MYIKGAVSIMLTMTIANARDRLAQLINRVQRGDVVELTRRGRPVAVVLSLVEYQRLSGASPDLMGRLEAYRRGLSAADDDELHEAFDDVRASESGRDVTL